MGQKRNSNEKKMSDTPPKAKTPPVQFKKENADRLKKEWKDLDQQNKPLKAMLIDLNKYTWKKFKKTILFTEIFRTQTQQDEYYWNNRKYRRKPWKSCHQFWQGSDLRSWIFTEEERDDICDYLNKKYNKSNYWKWTAKVHTVGHGFHFHLQFLKK